MMSIAKKEKQFKISFSKTSLGGITMNKPYIVCHMSVSIDGKITGEYADSSLTEGAYKDYEIINRFYAPQAWVNGRITVDENFTFY